MGVEWLGWHFLSSDRCLDGGNGCQVRVGETYTVEGHPVLCEHGLHASRRAIDALKYAPGPIVCRVRLGGLVVEDDDKAAATERTVFGMADVTQALHEFAVWCAEGALRRDGVTDERCWRALKTKLAWLDGAATDQELASARDAAEDIAWDVAWDAAGDVAWDAAGDAAEDAARAAAWAAAGNPAENPGWVATWDAARDAAEKEQNAELERRLLALFERNETRRRQ